MRVFDFFHFIQNAVVVKKIMNNRVLEYCKFDFFGHKKG